MVVALCNLVAYSQIQRCGTPTPSQTVQANLFYKTTATTVTIPVIVHVVYASDGTGNIPDSQVQAQVDTLNATYIRAGTRYRFYLAAVSRTQNDTWHRATRGSQAELDMTNALALDTKDALNLYVINTDPYFGWVIKWPWEVSETSLQHGVIIHYGSVPGGYITNFNWGYTAVHEGGHYLGLYHTFQNGCTPPGDEVDDTPYHQVNYGCPTPTPDTCPQSGIDPIHNYMNYTDDPCYFEFTPNQGTRNDAIVGQYKPNLGSSSLVIDGSKTLTVNYTFYVNLAVSTGSSLQVNSGLTIKFAQGVSMTVNGTLNTTNATFTGTPSPGWGGIYFASGSSGTINGCTISNVHSYGGAAITINNTYVWINNSTIENTTGVSNGVSILENSSAGLSRNTIRNHSRHGVYIYRSSPFLQYNNITGTTGTGNAAVSCNYYSNPLFGNTSYPYDGRNTLTGGYYGISASGNSMPNLGSDPSTATNHRIFGNSYADAYAENTSTIYARYAWWGQSPPNTSKIIATGGSIIYYDPWLTSDPGPAFRTSPSPPDRFILPALAAQQTGQTTFDPRELLLQARQLRLKNEHSRAIGVYRSILATAPISDEAKIALVELGNVYGETKDQSLLQFIESFTQKSNPFRATALELLANSYKLDGKLKEAEAINNLHYYRPCRHRARKVCEDKPVLPVS